MYYRALKVVYSRQAAWDSHSPAIDGLSSESISLDKLACGWMLPLAFAIPAPPSANLSR